MKRTVSSLPVFLRNNYVAAGLLWAGAQILFMFLNESLGLRLPIQTLTLYVFTLSFLSGYLIRDIENAFKTLLITQVIGFAGYSILKFYLFPPFPLLTSETQSDTIFVVFGVTLLFALPFFFYAIIGSIFGAFVGQWKADREYARKLRPLPPLRGRPAVERRTGLESGFGIPLIVLGGFLLFFGYTSRMCYTVFNSQQLFCEPSPGSPLEVFLGAVITTLGTILLVGRDVVRLLRRSKGIGDEDSGQGD